MRKIPTLYLRDNDSPQFVINVVNPEAAWVLKGQGEPTIQYDGTACLVRDGSLYKRYDRKPSKKGGDPKPEPPGWLSCEERPDATGHWPGWVPGDFDDPQDQWHKEAWDRRLGPDGRTNLPNGTYELVGPKVQGNPYELEDHQLWPHGVTVRQYSPDFDIEPPRNYDGLRTWFETWENVEGIVWWHPDGRMAKLKRKDFGMPWPPER